MTTANNMTGQNNKITALYCRLSQDDLPEEKAKRKRKVEDESNSITNQKKMLLDFAKRHGFTNTEFFVDDGVSGTTFDRPDFIRMEEMIERGEIGTVIVKDLSRFGRNYLEAGQYLEIKYPTLGVRFIAIQENVDTEQNTGAEMMPFHNIFNEWYAAQTSKKIRAVNRMKAENGKRISSAVPYGYKKNPDDEDHWLIDEPAAEVVRRIYDLCLAGRGPAQIARQLEKEQVMTPTEYFHSKGKKTSNDLPVKPFRWGSSTIVSILGNRQYTGCAVNFKSTTISYKVHKTVHNLAEEQQILPNMQEPIISEDVWERVQVLRENKRRPTATGRKSLFSGLVYCPDCGAKMYFCASKSLRKDQEFFRCSNYNSASGTCKIHFIRDVVLEKLVTEAISDIADFIRCYEQDFLNLIKMRNAAGRDSDIQALKSTILNSNKRIKEIDRNISSLFEKNVNGVISDERFMTMTADYESEQRALKQSIADAEEQLAKAEQNSVDVRMLLNGFRQYSEMRELTPEIVNMMIQRIEVHNNDKYDGHCHVKVDIYFTGVGLFERPTQQELQTLADMHEQN
ncbi:MAG: recombinase family protein [Eubacteriales bacterium]|nr:recombinase family protein [Eubacteriales bacterium]